MWYLVALQSVSILTLSVREGMGYLNCLFHPLQTIAAYLRVYLGRLDKLQGKAVTHLSEVEWWRTLMVECETVF